MHRVHVRNRIWKTQSSLEGNCHGIPFTLRRDLPCFHLHWEDGHQKWILGSYQHSSWSKDKTSLLEGGCLKVSVTYMCLLSRNRRLQLKLKLLLLFIAIMFKEFIRKKIANKYTKKIKSAASLNGWKFSIVEWGWEKKQRNAILIIIWIRAMLIVI